MASAWIGVHRRRLRASLRFCRRVVMLSPRACVALVGLLLIAAGVAWWAGPAMAAIVLGAAMFVPAQAERWMELRRRGK